MEELKEFLKLIVVLCVLGFFVAIFVRWFANRESKDSSPSDLYSGEIPEKAKVVKSKN